MAGIGGSGGHRRGDGAGGSDRRGRAAVHRRSRDAEDPGGETQSNDAPLPQAIGARLEVTGDRQGAFDLNSERGRDDGSLGLEGDAGRIFFAADLSIEQMSYDGLDFFPDPGDCELIPGEINEVDTDAMSFTYDRQSDTVELDLVVFEGTENQVPPLVCKATTKDLGALSPTSIRVEVTVECDPFRVVGLGEVGLAGSAVVDKVFWEPPS